jgi:pimeloyl-ACP methyl ester carboxylesterase
MAEEAAIVAIGDVEIELRRRGRGRPLLLLAGEDMLEADAPFLDALAQDFDIFLPSPPGFGRSNRPDWITSPDDIAYLYLSLLERLALDDVAVVGCSLGGWIAAEMAVKDDARFSRLVLVDPYGVKFGGPAEREIADLWQIGPQKTAALKWRDPAKGKLDTATLSDEQLAMLVRNQESFAAFCWDPYMHNPKLKHRLARIGVPTLLVWGEHDGIVAPSYGKSYGELIPGARLSIVPGAGHYPHLEQPAAFLDAIRDFLR